jgi:hypothetical protein
VTTQNRCSFPFPFRLLFSSSIGKHLVNTIVEHDESVYDSMSLSVSSSDDDDIFFEQEDGFKTIGAWFKAQL